MEGVVEDALGLCLKGARDTGKRAKVMCGRDVCDDQTVQLNWKRWGLTSLANEVCVCCW